MTRTIDVTAPVTRPDRVAAVRAFNRFYTAVIGVLDERMLHTAYTLTEARVIFELAQQPATEVVRLRRGLDLDAGYLSRILARFEADGLIARTRSASDARRQVITLTDAGRRTWRSLDERSAAEVAALLGRLDEDGQRRLLSAMSSIRRMLDADRDRADQVVLRPPAPGDFGWIVQRHGVLYAREYGWDQTFEAFVARIVADYATDHDPRREAAWIADLGGEPVGSVLCTREDDRTARLRVLLVEPAARGMGVGAQLVDQCLRFARHAGYQRIVLFTCEVLAGARRIYQRAGFQLVDEHPTRAYGHDVVEQNWALELAATPPGRPAGSARP
ncbi:helix-turn-helix domain-containing GNAT family N-acetyltransferase [Solwaraspora sp. WMMD1047]|uniref:bifunctional helix-turn-helix transcriptional regulator/GNAT family N-acetyltransferase n=1 Tax=Solwaraspora sp. WMMD1047 TaxID=3016102 RepID=UPI002416B5E5|nr:helix-turn-helix domain-containing GNAT family N-acetyltransferase [Solwaraspora sp. WMMD1047]MDG4828378.1 helix-turn-helix domain-containing GNAT family N-acetyltransferase [Solwaraspora sp. WMMD1047]